MSEVPQNETGSAWAPPRVSVPKDPDDDKDVPQPVRDEEALLDAIVSHTDVDGDGDVDAEDLKDLRGKVSQWYDTTGSTGSEK